MSRYQDRQCNYNRWSEPILRRRYSMRLVSTSEEDVSSIQRSRSTSPLLNSCHPPMLMLDEQSGCCSCHCGHYNRKKTSKNHSANSSKANIEKYQRIVSEFLNSSQYSLKIISCIRKLFKELVFLKIRQLLHQQKSNVSQQMRESLVIQLVGSQVEEASAGDEQATLIQHLDLSTSTLEALIQHIRSLEVPHVSAQRVVYLAQRMILSRSSTIINYTNSLTNELTTRLCQAESCNESRLRLLREMVENCCKNIMVSKQLQSLIDDHKMKKEDFTIAAKNFKDLLESSKLTVSQMDKLQSQYQAIMDDYRQNRRVLDSELPKIINTRLSAIRQGFCMIAAFYEDIEYYQQISELFKILSKTLGQEEPATTGNYRNQHHHNQEPEKSQAQQEMCQKCKVNRVEKK